MVRAAGRLIRRSVAFLATPPSFPPFREGTFRSRLHDEAPAAWLGLSLGVAFTVCFITGLFSHLIQHGGSLRVEPLATGGGWAGWPDTPAGLYRVTQGLHVVTGFASIPLLLIKLFVVYHHLFKWPPVRSVRHAAERAGLLALVGGAIFLLVTGVQNVMYWYPWGFFFPTAHYWAAWIMVGGLVTHVGAKAHVVRRVLRRPGLGLASDAAVQASASDPTPYEASPDSATSDAVSPAAPPPDEAARGTLDRRGVLVLAGAASGLVVLTTAGATVAPLERLALLSLRQPSVGPQGFPVNKTAKDAGVVEAAMDPAWTLVIGGRVEGLRLSLADLQAMDQREVTLPIACVEGWSASVRWSGVPLAALLRRAGAPPDAGVRVESLQRGGLYRGATLSPHLTADDATLLALAAEGAPLHIDHGFPARLIAPNNPGVLQTKWVGSVTVL